VKLTKGADDTVASLGKILKSFHEGGAELPPVGGIVIVGGDRGGRAAVAWDWFERAGDWVRRKPNYLEYTSFLI
jgi:hypothetical protein